MKYSIEPNQDATILDFSKSCSLATENETFIDEDNNTIEVRSYNHENKYCNMKAFKNANANKCKQELKKRGGDVRTRLRMKLAKQDS